MSRDCRRGSVPDAVVVATEDLKALKKYPYQSD